MPRLQSEDWIKARSAYEVKGISLREVARRFGVSPKAVADRAKKEGWIQGKTKRLVERKVMAIKELAEIEDETKHLPRSYRHTIDTVARERLEAEGLLLQFDSALAVKGIELLEQATSAEDFELLARARRHMAKPEQGASAIVNVSQQQAVIKADTPRDAMAEITRQAMEYPDAQSDS